MPAVIYYAGAGALAYIGWNVGEGAEAGVRRFGTIMGVAGGIALIMYARKRDR